MLPTALAKQSCKKADVFASFAHNMRTQTGALAANPLKTATLVVDVAAVEKVLVGGDVSHESHDEDCRSYSDPWKYLQSSSSRNRFVRPGRIEIKREIVLVLGCVYTRSKGIIGQIGWREVLSPRMGKGSANV